MQIDASPKAKYQHDDRVMTAKLQLMLLNTRIAMVTAEASSHSGVLVKETLTHYESERRRLRAFIANYT